MTASSYTHRQLQQRVQWAAVSCSSGDLLCDPDRWPILTHFTLCKTKNLFYSRCLQLFAPCKSVLATNTWKFWRNSRCGDYPFSDRCTTARFIYPSIDHLTFHTKDRGPLCYWSQAHTHIHNPKGASLFFSQRLNMDSSFFWTSPTSSSLKEAAVEVFFLSFELSGILLFCAFVSGDIQRDLA